VQHEVPVNVDFKPKRLKAYIVPENLKTEVDLQISELLKRGIIKRSSSAIGCCGGVKTRRWREDRSEVIILTHCTRCNSTHLHLGGHSTSRTSKKNISF